ncbi:MAG: VIT and VWA domain-containing protein [Syntrophomonadaceae bacterium]
MIEYGLVSKQGVEKAALKMIEIKGKLVGEALLVNSRQKYINDAAPNAEFIYTFPLPDQAAVFDLTLKLHDTVIKGEIREKDAAFKLYDETLGQGDSAFLLEQVRENVFQISLGQIARGEEVEVDISYFQEIKTVDEEMRICIPTLLAPRYIPGKASGDKMGPGRMAPTDQVSDADFITPPVANVDYRASIEIELDALTPIKSVESASHQINFEMLGETRARVILAEGNSAMDRDFILKVQLSGEAPNRLIWGKNEQNEYFAGLSFSAELPPTSLRPACEYIFLIDISGSMVGDKSVQAAQAIQICLRNLGPEDVFNLAAFESETFVFSPVSLPYNQQNLEQASAWVENLPVMGGTEILPAVQFALGKGSSSEKVVLLFTDGQVGNEKEIIDLVNKNRDGLRLYSIGIDTTVNSHFINAVAAAGNGYAEFVYPGEELEEKILRHFSRIHANFIEEISIEFSDCEPFEPSGRLPERIYDLEPYQFIFRLSAPPHGRVSVSGIYAGRKMLFAIEEIQELGDAGVLEKLWAKQKITELNTYLSWGNPRRSSGIKADIIKLSERYRVISALASFVATYQRKNKMSGLPETVVIPVNAPHGWAMLEKAAEAVLVSCAPVDAGAATTGAISPTFLRQASMPFPANPGLLNRYTENAFNDFSVSRPLLPDSLNKIAAHQNSDGSFGSIESDASVRIKETAQAIVRFAGSRKISLYRNQLQKAIEYLVAMEALILADHALTVLVYEALEMAQERKIIRSNHKSILDLTAQLKAILSD